MAKNSSISYKHHTITIQPLPANNPENRNKIGKCPFRAKKAALYPLFQTN